MLEIYTWDGENLELGWGEPSEGTRRRASPRRRRASFWWLWNQLVSICPSKNDRTAMLVNRLSKNAPRFVLAIGKSSQRLLQTFHEPTEAF